LLPEHEALRREIVELWFDPKAADLFAWHTVEPRPVPERQIAFEPAWTEYREGTIYKL